MLAKNATFPHKVKGSKVPYLLKRGLGNKHLISGLIFASTRSLIDLYFQTYQLLLARYLFYTQKQSKIM